MRRIGLLFVMALAACPASSKGRGLKVTVVLEGPTLSKCVKLEVTGADLINSATVVVEGPRFSIAVDRGSLPTDVVLQAVGYADIACSRPTSPAEASERLAASFPVQGIADLTLTVRAGTSLDADRDGSPVNEDCDDTNPRRAPGLAEDCTDAIDNDCDTQSDCADLNCSTKACARAVSEQHAACVAGLCAELSCTNDADDDADALRDCADSDCDTKLCANGGRCTSGVCTNATSEVGLCRDGRDNDGDGSIDCLDADCLGSACNDQLTCNEAETCQASRTCGSGSTVVCSAPSSCFSNGTCEERPDGGGGCLYTVLTGNACSDSKACTTSDTCAADGGCAGTAVVCDLPPGPCFDSAGTCLESLDGGCAYPARQGSCDDGRACSVGDVCRLDGGCSGVEVICTPNECQTNGVCSEATGGCLFVPKTGQPCTGGLCTAQGQCAPSADAGTDAGAADAGTDGGFVPSNFDPSQLPPTSVNAVFTCDATLTVGDSTVTLEGDSPACAVPTIPSMTVTQPSPPNVLVLAMNSLMINTGVTLRVVGTRPVIFAVLADATINGVLTGDAVDSSRSGPGGNTETFCSTNRGTPGSSSSSPGGGGGGGAFGSAGGSGGPGDGSTTNGGAGAGVNGAETLMPLRGGCAGAYGGGLGGLLGRAGGALQVSAFGTLTVNGRITASGSRGLGSYGFSGGGGGGGSGGGLLLEARQVQLGASSRLTANGGGGGGGSTNRAGGAGQNGSQSATPALGGTAPECAGQGGQGAALLGAAAVGGAGGEGGGCIDNVGGGGGGGGGMGRIRLNATLGCTVAVSALVSPAATSAMASCRR